jgi:hypothetical protein
MGIHLMGVHLIGVHLMDEHLMNVPLSWASLAGLFRGYVAASAPKPVSSASAQEPVSPAPAPAPKPRRSKRTLSIPGHYGCFSRAQPAEASQGWKRVDSYSLASRATWIQF